MQLTPERLTDIFDTALDKSTQPIPRLARVEAMRVVMNAVGLLGKIDEEKQLADVYKALAGKAAQEDSRE